LFLFLHRVLVFHVRERRFVRLIDALRHVGMGMFAPGHPFFVRLLGIGAGRFLRQGEPFDG